MIRSNGNYNGSTNRNFAQMLEEINLNLQSFPLTSLNSNNSNANNSNNVGGLHSHQGGGSNSNNGFSSAIVGHSSSNVIQASLLNGESSSSQQAAVGGYHNRYQIPSNNPNSQYSQYESLSNNYIRNRENNSQHNNNHEAYSQSTNSNSTNNNNRKKQNSSPKIQDILTCFICLGKLKNAHMCPDCQKMCCEGCIKEWLSSKSQCPHCRSHLRPSKLMKCRFVNEITIALEKIEEIEQKKEKQGICQEHENPLLYYCQICKHPVCSDCGMIGSRHKNHKFEKLNAVYDLHVKQVRSELSAVKKKLSELGKQQTEVDIVIEKITKMRDDKASSLAQQMEYVNRRLNELLKSKLEKLSLQRGPISEEIDLLENMSEEINHHIDTLPKSLLINKSGEIIKTLEEINNRRVLKNYIGDNEKKLDFSYDIIPSYDSAEFYLENYSVKRRSADVSYSETLYANGNEWRLKVYLNGKDKAKDSFLSVFVEMTKGSVKPSNFEYRVEMINQLNPDASARVIREFISPFETGATWGYEKFFKLSQLESEGYLIPSSDVLIFKYYVRSPSYSQFCNSKQNRIDELETKNQQLLDEIKLLKENQTHNDIKSSQAESNLPQLEDVQKSIIGGVNESKADNFELETFIQEMDHGNISNMRSELENYIKQKNLEEFAKSDTEYQDEAHEHDQEDDEVQDDGEDEDQQGNNGEDEEDEEEEDDEEEDEEEDDDEEGEVGVSKANETEDFHNQENSFVKEDSYIHSHHIMNRDQLEEEYFYDNEEDLYQYKCSLNGDNQRSDIMNKFIKGNGEDDDDEDEFEKEQNDPMDCDSFIDELAKRKLKRKQEIELRDQQYLKEELELNSIAKDIQNILKQETEKVTYRLKSEQNCDKIGGNRLEDDLNELDLYCKMDEEDIINDISSLQVSKQYIDNTQKQSGFNSNKNEQQEPFKFRDHEISSILQGNKLTERSNQSNDDRLKVNQQQSSYGNQSVSQPKENDYRLRWNGIMQNVNHVLKGTESTNNPPNSSQQPYSLKTNMIQQHSQSQLQSQRQTQNLESDSRVNESNYEEKKSQEDNEENELKDSDIPDITMILDQIGDKVHFVPLSQSEINNIQDNNINVKKNLLPEFEQEALRLEEKKLEQQQYQLYQQQQKIRNIFSANSATSTPTASQNIIGLSKTDRYNNAETQNQVSTKSKYSSNCEEQTFQSAKANNTQQNFQQPTFAQYQKEQEKLHQNSQFPKDSGYQATKFDAFLAKYENQLKTEQNNIIKADTQVSKNDGLNSLKSDRLYTYSVNTNKVEGKDALMFETHQYKYQLKKLDKEQSVTPNSGLDTKSSNNHSNGPLTSSVSLQSLQTSSNNTTNLINKDSEISVNNNLVGTFTNPTLSKLVATHSQQKITQEEINRTQTKNTTTSNNSANINLGSILGTNNSSTSYPAAGSKKTNTKTEKSEVYYDDLEIEGDNFLEKENKDDSLLAMERQIQKLEMMNQMEEELKEKNQQTQSKISQQKEQPLNQQSQNIPSQQSVTEARKQLTNSINFPEGLLKKINKVKQYGNPTSVATTTSTVNNGDISSKAHQQKNEQQNSITSENASNASEKSQQKVTLIKSSTSELGIALKQVNSQATPSVNLNTLIDDRLMNKSTNQQSNSQSLNNSLQPNKNPSPAISESSDIKKQEEEIQKLENLVVDNQSEK